MQHRARQVAPGVAVVETAVVNAYLVGDARTWVLVDSGLPGFAARIKGAAEARFGRGARPRAILLTHGHFDHAGNAQTLAEQWDVPVHAHRLEWPFLTGAAKYPPYDVTAPGAFALLSRMFPQSSTVRLGGRLRAIEGALSGLGLDDWACLHTPGHCAGHVAFFRARDGVLLAGDSLATVDLDSLPALVSWRKALSRPPTPATTDWGQAAASVARLAALRPQVIAAGHGKPMHGAADQLRWFADHFPVPRRGRYVHTPAVTDETGIRSLPPAPFDPLPLVAAGVLAAGLGVLAARSGRRDRQVRPTVSAAN